MNLQEAHKLLLFQQEVRLTARQLSILMGIAVERNATCAEIHKKYLPNIPVTSVWTCITKLVEQEYIVRIGKHYTSTETTDHIITKLNNL